MQAVKQSYFKYLGGTARYWGDLDFFYTPYLAIQIIYSRFYLISGV